jgi:hypothetical protein
MDDLILILMWIGGIALILIALILIENAIDEGDRHG